MPLPFPLSWFLNSSILVVGDTAAYTGCWLRAYTASLRIFSKPCKVLPPILHGNYSQKSMSPASQASCSRAVGNMVRSKGPQPRFVCCEVSSLIYGDIVWNTMTTDKTFCKSKDGSFGRSTVCKESKCIRRVCVPVITNAAPPITEAVQRNQPATSGLLITLGTSALWEVSVFSAISKSDPQHWPWLGWPWWVEAHVAEPMRNLHLCHCGRLVHEPNVGAAWGKRLTATHRIHYPIHLIMKSFLCWGHPSVSIHMECRYLHIFGPFERIYPYTSCPHFLVASFPNMFLPSPW